MDSTVGTWQTEQHMGLRVLFAACLSSVSLHLTSLVISVRLKTFDICQQSETQTRHGRKVRVNIFIRPAFTKFYLVLYFIF